MIRVTCLAVIATIVFGSGYAHASSIRNLCKKFFYNMNYSSCKAQQEAALKRLESGVYYNNVTNACKQQNKLIDRKAVYYNYIGADSCAKREQKRIAQEEEMRAAAARDRAATDYLKRTERVYREKYYKRKR